MVVLMNSAGWRYENRSCNLYGQPSFSLSPEALMAPLGIRRRRRTCVRHVRRDVLDATLIINVRTRIACLGRHSRIV